MSRKTVSPGGLTDAIEGIIKEYTDEVVRALPDAVKQSAKECVKALKSNAASAVGGTVYKGSFKSKKTSDSYGLTEYTVYSTKYRIAHLLEHGHVIKNQTGRVYGVTAARPHWAPAEEVASKALEEAISKKVEEAG